MTLSSLPEPGRMVCVGVLMALAGADGVVDDEELLPLLGELGIGDLSPAARARIAAWLVCAPDLSSLLPELETATPGVRFGLALRLVELAGADAFIAPGELAGFARVAPALRVTDDQLGALRAFLLDLDEVATRGHEQAVRSRILRLAGSTLDAAGVPAEALAWCAALTDLEGTDALAEGLGLADLDPILGDAAARAVRRATAVTRLREGLDGLLAALLEQEQAQVAAGADRRELVVLELRRHALERRRRSIG